MKIRVRFAPSPTGNLHVGGLRTAIFNWLWARKQGGQFLLRIEDTDQERSNPEFTKAIIDSMAWLGIQSDEPLIFQSQRFDRYSQIIWQLVAQGKAYRCFCSVDQLGQLRKDAGEGFVYPRTCRMLSIEEQEDLAQSRPHVVRFKVPDNLGDMTFIDMIREDITIAAEKLDDFILLRQDGAPTYNLAVVVDDSDMRISHVIRGEEHIANTFKQLLIYQALELEAPQFAHLPMILGKSGEKLSKRDGAVSVEDYRVQGFLPQALMNYLVRLGWSHGSQEVFTLQEMIQFFSIEKVGKKGAIFDLEKLYWLNSVYVQQLTWDEFLRHLETADALLMRELVNLPLSEVKLGVLFDLWKPRSNTLIALAKAILEFWQFGEQPLNASLVEQLKMHQAFLMEVQKLILGQQDLSAQQVEQVVKTVVLAMGIKAGQANQALRLALTGQAGGPSLWTLAECLGYQNCWQRLQRAVEL